MKRFVYADNAATTKINDGVLNSMLPYLREQFGNPSSIYSVGRDAQTAITVAREQVAKALNCDPGEIYFTSGGSESDNWAIKGAAKLGIKKGKTKIITSVIEHHAVLHTVDSLKKDGFEICMIDVNDKGIVNLEKLAKEIDENTAIVSIMFANNEIGTIQPIKEIGEICKQKGVFFHTDAVQAIGNIPIDVKNMNIDMLSLSGHKIHAQKGIGALYVRKGIVLPNLIDGGAQEKGKRAGTENVPAIVGLGYAITEANNKIPRHIEKMLKLRNELIDGILKIERSHLNGDINKRLCSNVNISFEGVEGESLLLMLDMNGICASSGSACTSGSLDPSHVLLAIGLPHEIAHGSLRLSLGDDNNTEDVEYILKTLPKIIDRLRSMSPLWERIKKAEIDNNKK